MQLELGMTPILVHPIAKSITLTTNAKLLYQLRMRIFAPLLTGQHCALHTAALPGQDRLKPELQTLAYNRPCANMLSC